MILRDIGFCTSVDTVEDESKTVTVTVRYENERGEYDVTRHYRVRMANVPPKHIFEGVKERTDGQIEGSECVTEVS